MDPLVGDAENGGDVAHADPPAGQRDGGFAGLLDGHAVGDAGLLDGAAGGLRQDWLGDKGDSALIGVEAFQLGRGTGMADHEGVLTDSPEAFTSLELWQLVDLGL